MRILNVHLEKPQEHYLGPKEAIVPRNLAITFSTHQIYHAPWLIAGDHGGAG